MTTLAKKKTKQNSYRLVLFACTHYNSCLITSKVNYCAGVPERLPFPAIFVLACPCG